MAFLIAINFFLIILLAVLTAHTISESIVKIKLTTTQNVRTKIEFLPF